MRFLTFIFLFIAFGFYSQEAKTEFIVKDFNSDGSTDSLKWFYDGGSGFGGYYYTLVNGKTKERVEVNTFACFCQINNVILIPQSLKKKENQGFLDALEKQMLPEKKLQADPSLQWILDGTMSSKEMASGPFEKVFLSPPQWKKFPLSEPGYYSMKLKGELLKRMYHPEEGPYKWKTQDEGWVAYNGKIHKNQLMIGPFFRPADSNSVYKAYITSHGVVIQKKSEYAWSFVTDAYLTGGPEKLRWESIKKVKLVDAFLIVEQSLSPDISTNLFFIDIEKGKVGKLKIEGVNYEIDHGTIMISDHEVKKTLSLKEWFKN
ncbi:MAG: hypothetical protein K0S32_2232 [Bacteroidetes bacterium]|jgi:hypothetical protein|nr:hypothetical protein [Bacteroidota bacterium]